jgi:hypothetical protein
MILWTSVLLHIGIGAWCFGMAIHNDWWRKARGDLRNRPKV